MRRYRWVILSIIAYLAIAVVMYIWGTALMSSLYNYRSPLADQPPAGGQSAGAPLSRYVVAIMVDGLRADIAADGATMPYLTSLREKGASATIRSGVPSYSIPAWSVLATGAWQDLSDGPAMNPNADKDYHPWSQDNIFTAVHKAGLRSAVAANYHFKYLIPVDAMDESFYSEEETDASDVRITEAALRFIRSGHYDYVFIHLNQVDYAAHHQGGPLSAEGKAAAFRSDRLIRQITEALDLSRDTMLVYSDHGQIDAGGHGGQDTAVVAQPLVMAGANVKAGKYADVLQVDIAPTTAVLLGTALPAISQGHALTEMLTLNPVQLETLRRAAVAQQSTLYRAYAASINVPATDINLTVSQYPVGVYQAAMLELRDNRLNGERVLRFLPVLVLALLPLYFIFRYRSRNMLWFFLATAIYLAVFNILYIVVGSGTYTLSSVISSSNLTSTTALYAGIAFLIAWLIFFLGLRLFAKPRLPAVHLHIELTFILLYLLSLPVLWSLAWNGVKVGWTLPDIASMFTGFMFMLQMLFVAVVGLILTAVTALASGWKPQVVSGNRN